MDWAFKPWHKEQQSPAWAAYIRLNVTESERVVTDPGLYPTEPRLNWDWHSFKHWVLCHAIVVTTVRAGLPW